MTIPEMPNGNGAWSARLLQVVRAPVRERRSRREHAPAGVAETRLQQSPEVSAEMLGLCVAVADLQDCHPLDLASLESSQALMETRQFSSQSRGRRRGSRR
jgi:hypothetical protein